MLMITDPNCKFILKFQKIQAYNLLGACKTKVNPQGCSDKKKTEKLDASSTKTFTGNNLTEVL